jgi:hypothetical protein
MKAVIILELCAIIFICCQKAEENRNIGTRDGKYRVKIQKLLLREKPSINSKVLSSLIIDSELELISETDVLSTINGMNKKWYKVKTINGLIGYVYSGYLTKYDNRVFKINEEPFDITGHWGYHFDPPNEIFNFYKDKRFERVYHQDYGHEEVFKGHYQYDGVNTIIIKEENKKEYIIRVIKYRGGTTLKYDDYFFDLDFHMK